MIQNIINIHFDGNVAKFSEIVGASRSQMSMFLSGVAGLGARNAKPIIRFLLDMNYDIEDYLSEHQSPDLSKVKNVPLRRVVEVDPGKEVHLVELIGSDAKKLVMMQKVEATEKGKIAWMIQAEKSIDVPGLITRMSKIHK